MSWTYLTTAPDQLVAEMWARLLQDNGVACMVRPGDTTSFLGVSANPCRLLVRAEDLDRARELLRDLLDNTPMEGG